MALGFLTRGSASAAPRQLGPPTPRLSAAADLGVGQLQRENLNLDLIEEQKKRKRLLEQQGFGGTMSAAYMSLMGESGNQY